MAQPAFPRSFDGASPLAVPEEARPFLQALLNAPGWSVGFLDRELRLRWASDTLAALAGQPMSSQLGRALTDLWPALAPALAPLCAKALQGEAVSGAKVSGALGHPRDGGLRHLRVSLLPAVAGGMLSGFTLMVQDETERAREEQFLRESEERMKALLDISCDGYVIHDGGRIVDASRGCGSLLATTPEGMIGSQLMQWIAPECRPIVADAGRRAAETPYEVSLLRQDGQRVPVQVLVKEVTFRGQRARMGALWDISSRKAAEQAAAHDASFREQLLGVVGHDLRQPLDTLQRGVSALQREMKLEGAPARQVMQVAGAARGMERMLRELLDFTRSRLTGSLSVTPAPMSLEPMLERALEEQRQAHPGRSLVRTTEGDLRGHWDETRLMQVVDTLLANALQSSPESSPVELCARGTPEGVTLEVLDKGPPLLPEDQEALFEPFRKSRKAGRESQGMGLYLARRIAEAHGGRLSVESCRDRGTCFKVWLPRRAPGA